ncbi:MAG: hypothetical protein Q7U10_11920 [Thermodesulfovibrionia bacterium]|nr:hypothetical protein [Thermodesulfovibrionia bacterium]
MLLIRNNIRAYLLSICVFSFLSLLVSCASTPLPSSINIISPSQNVPSEFAAFSGKWEGKWNNYLDGMLIVERIDEKNADIIISWGEVYGLKKGFLEATVDVLPGPTLIYEDEINRWTYKMNDDLKSISGEIFEKAPKARMKALMKKVH